MSKWLHPFLGAVLGTIIAWVSVPRIEALVYLSIPVSRWFEVHGVAISDTVMGESAHVAVDREIHRPFTASWTVKLRRELGNGFTAVCARHGKNDYRPGSTLPPDTDLRWWMAIPPNPECRRIAPGRYIVTILWNVEAEGLPPKVVRAESNLFEIRP